MKIPSLIPKPTTLSSVINGGTGNSVSDTIINQGKIKAQTQVFKHAPDIVSENAKRAVEEMAANDASRILQGQGVSPETTKDLISIARNGKDAIDSMVNLGTKAIDGMLGTSFNELYHDLIPGRDADNTEPPPLGLGKPSPNSVLAKMRMRADPQFSFNWRCYLPTIPGENGASSFDESILSVFNYYVEDVSISLPFFSSQDYFRNGTRVYYPTYSDTGTINITFYEDGFMNVTRYLEAWKNLIQNRVTGLYNYPSIYKKEIRVEPLSNIGVPGGTFLVKGAFPTQSQPVSFGANSSEVIKVSQEFSVNRILFIPNKSDELRSSVRDTVQAVDTTDSNNNPISLTDIMKDPINFGKQILGISK